MKKYLFVILIFFPLIIYSQDFGCYSISSAKENSVLDGVYLREHTPSRISENFDWQNNFKIDSLPNGYYKEYYSQSEYFPKKIKMEGNIENGKPEGKWILYLENSSNFIVGNYHNGLKEGVWKFLFVKETNDTICFDKMDFKSNLLENEKIEYYNNGQISKIIHYKNGEKHGEEIEYFENKENVVEKYSNYNKGLFDGVKIKYSHNNDTLEYETYILGKKNGKCIYYDYKGKIRNVIDFKNDKFDGDYIKYFDNGRIAYIIECKNNLPFTSILANDSTGIKLNQGTLKNGNGTLFCYFANGQLQSSCNYKNQLMCGEINTFYKSGLVGDTGKVFANNEKSFKENTLYVDIEDFNIYSSKQQNFSTGTNIVSYDENGKLEYKYFYQDTNSLEFKGLVFHKFAANGNLIYQHNEVNRLIYGEVKEYYDDSKISAIENYDIIQKDSIKESVKNGTFKYFYQNGILKAEITYKNNNETGKSFFYDDSGILKRIKIICDNGEIYNIYNGDTVNKIDSNGLKQGKWISFPYHSKYSNTCQDQPNGIEYYNDDKPIGTWETFNYRATKLYRKFIWIDYELAKYFEYNYDEKLLYEGFKINQEIKHGEWKEYDSTTGYLKYIGNYILDKKEGIWQEFKKNGKLKNEVLYENDKVIKKLKIG